VTGEHILAIDQGTTSTRAVVYDRMGRVKSQAAQELTQYYPQSGWVEHDADEIWQSVLAVVPQAVESAGIRPQDLAAIGLTNQRETSVLWDRADGAPVGRALVWQDRRTADFCREHHSDEAWISARTGLVLDPYFSGTKIRWQLNHAPELRSRADAGKLAWGTVDSFLIWRLTGGKVHATDVTNASRTLLLNLATAQWDDELCNYFGVPAAILPVIQPSAGTFGSTQGVGALPDGIPITGAAGDQQAALFGQRGLASGDAKCTYGTGAFFLLHTGDRPIVSHHRLVSTLAATVDNQPKYALEGSVFVAGAAVQWLRDGLKLLGSAQASEELARKSDPEQAVIFVPALVGLGAPHWVPEARGVLFGITRGTTAAELARAALEGVAFQVADLIDAADRDAGVTLPLLRVDGGMSRNAWFLQRQADLLGLPIFQAAHGESTALGAAFLAGLGAKIWPDLDALRRLPEDGNRFEPRMPAAEREQRRQAWRRAVDAVVRYYALTTETQRHRENT
jgi:glycerol kinase